MLLLKVSLRPCVLFFKIWVVKRRPFYVLSPSGRMNKLSVSIIDAYVGNFSDAGGIEEHKISFFQSASPCGHACIPLRMRRSGKFQSVQLVYRPGEPAAVKSFLGGLSAPPVGNSDEAAGCSYDFISQISR
jgi:hypothetical protein